MILDARASFLNTYVLKAGDTMTGALTVNVNSATALLVEQDGVNDNVLLVDTAGPDVTVTGELLVDGYDAIVREAGATVYPVVYARAVSTSGYPIVALERAAGTAFGAEAVAPQYGTLGRVEFKGWNGSAYGKGAEIKGWAEEAYDGSGYGSAIEFFVCGTNSTSLTRAMYIAQGGDITIGTSGTFPNATLHVDQASTTGAQPVLYLDQADIDLEFIKFVGSSEDSQADRSLVDAADMTTPGALTGWIQVYVEDIQGTNPITDGVYYIPFYAAPSA